jgi:hypothetical protein
VAPGGYDMKVELDGFAPKEHVDLALPLAAFANSLIR